MSLLTEYKTHQKNHNPLAVIWNIFSIITGLLSLASIADTLTQWKSFFLKVISLYRSIFHPLFEYLFSWVWFPIPTYIYDYLIIGFLIATTYVRALKVRRRVEGLSGIFLGLHRSDIRNILDAIGLLLARTIFWPFFFFVYLYRLIKGFNEEKSKKKASELWPENTPDRDGLIEEDVMFDFADYIESIRFFQWLGTLAFLLILLLTVNLAL